MTRSIRRSRFWLALVLLPGLLGVDDCAQGDTDLAVLEFKVNGVDQVQGFDPALKNYPVTTSSSTATLRAVPEDLTGLTTYQWFDVTGMNFISGASIGYGGGEVPIDVPLGNNRLRVFVYPTQGDGAFYTVVVDRVDPCGDGILDPGEACDDGGVDTQLCDSDCTLPVCGDLHVNPVAGEECDEGGIDTMSCDSDCTLPVCGDSYVNGGAGEQCDDGNMDPGDGCDLCMNAPMFCELDLLDCSPGEGCFPTLMGAFCFPEGSTPEDDSCVNQNDCQAGFGCITRQVGSAGPLCTELCDTANGFDCISGGPCSALPGPSGFGVCDLDPCDPLDILTCGPGLGCFPTNLGDLCLDAGAVPVGASCLTHESCMAGSWCVDPGTGVGDICMLLCDPTNGNDDCSGAELCAPLQSEPSIGVCFQPIGPPCTGTPGSGLPDDPEFCAKTIPVGAGQNVTPSVFIFPNTLEVRPTSPITANQPFTADLSGTVEFAEDLVDFLQAAVPGGASSMLILDLVATVQTRGGGATGADVAMSWDSSSASFVCGLTGAACDPANDDGSGGNTDCVPTGSFNPCQQVVVFPTSVDCAPGGTCDTLGKLGQCNDNGFCATGGVQLPLTPVVGASYTAGDGVSAGQTEALFGWADTPPPTTAVGVPPIDPDGTWNMLTPSFGGATGELGIRINIQGLFLAFEGVMAVDSNGPDGVGVPFDASPTPDSVLISFPVQTP